MTTVLVNNMSQAGIRLLEHIKLYPEIAQIVDNIDHTPLPVPESELISLGDFKLHMEDLAQTRLGINLKL